MSYSTDSVFQSGRDNLRFGGEYNDNVLNTLTSPYGGSGSAAGQDLSRAYNFGQKFTGLGAESVANSFIGQIKANPNAGDVSFDFNPFEAGTGGFDSFSPYSTVNLNNLRNSGSAFGQDVGNRVTDFTNTWNPDAQGSTDNGSSNNGDGNMADTTDVWGGFLNNNPTGDDGVGYQGAGFNSSFGSPNEAYGGANTLNPTTQTKFNNTSTQTAYSPANQGMMNTQGFTNNSTMGAFTPPGAAPSPMAGYQTNINNPGGIGGDVNGSGQMYAGGSSNFNEGTGGGPGFDGASGGPTPTGGGLPPAPNPYQPNQQNMGLTQMSNAPNQSIYNTGGVQNDMNSYFQGGQQLPQIQSMMEEMQRQQQLEGQNLQEQMTNRGLGNSTLNDTAVQDLGARQRNEQMNLATNATMQLLPMQVQLAEQMRQGDMAQRGQQTQEMFGALGLQDQLTGSQFGRDLAGRQQGVSELFGSLGLGEQLTQGQYGRGADTARMNDQFMQSQFGRDATAAQLQDQFTNSAFGRGQSQAQLNEALTQGQFGRDAATAQLEDQLTGSQFGRDQTGYQNQLNEFMGMADLYNQNRQIDYGQRQGAFDSFSNALGRLNPSPVGAGGEPGPDAWESGLGALMTFLGNKPWQTS